MLPFPLQLLIAFQDAHALETIDTQVLHHEDALARQSFHTLKAKRCYQDPRSSSHKRCALSHYRLAEAAHQEHSLGPSPYVKTIERLQRSIISEAASQSKICDKAP